MPVPNTAYTRPPDAVWADSSELLASSVLSGYFSALNPVARVYANR